MNRKVKKVLRWTLSVLTCIGFLISLITLGRLYQNQEGVAILLGLLFAAVAMGVIWAIVSIFKD